MTSDPRKFYNEMLKPAYDDWLANPYDEWRAKAAVGFANDTAERFAIHLKYPKGARSFREYLTSQICNEFGWIWDVADGTKHLTLNRGSRRISSSTQTSFRHLNIDDWPDFDNVQSIDDHGAIIVTADDGSERDLADLMAKVMAMYERLLQQHGL